MVGAEQATGRDTMVTLRAIVAATDFSPPALQAADRAAWLAREAGAALALLHGLPGGALDDLRRWLGADDLAESLRADARQRLQTQADDLAHRHGLPVDMHLSGAGGAAGLVDAVEALQADLLVTGTRGSRFVHGVLLGSTAERLARDSRRPVLLVRQPASGPYRRVLVAVDFSPGSTAAVAAARGLAPVAELVLLHALERPLDGPLRLAGADARALSRYAEAAQADARRRLQALVPATGLAADAVQLQLPAGGDPWLQVLQARQALGADLVVVGQHARPALGALLLGRTARMVVAECGCDVLIVPPPAA